MCPLLHKRFWNGFAALVKVKDLANQEDVDVWAVNYRALYFEDCHNELTKCDVASDADDDDDNLT